MTLDRRTLLGAATAFPLAARVSAQTPPPGSTALTAADPHETIDLWPGGAPGTPTVTLIETVDERSKNAALSDRAVHGISRPRLVVFRPTVPNGGAVLVMPGGGYRWVVIDKEGYEIARWLAARGFTVFVLFYRLPGEGWQRAPDVALADAQRAMRLIRARARNYGISADRVAAMGFSAGGHVCGDLATRSSIRMHDPVDRIDQLSAKPDIVALIYAVQSMSLPLAHPGSRKLLIGDDAPPALERVHTTALNVSAQTPPTFLVHAEDDAVVSVDNTLAFRAALRTAGVPVETHLFSEGGHGFGLRRVLGKPAEVWPNLFLAWAASRGFG